MAKEWLLMDEENRYEIRSVRLIGNPRSYKPEVIFFINHPSQSDFRKFSEWIFGLTYAVVSSGRQIIELYDFHPVLTDVRFGNNRTVIDSSWCVSYKDKKSYHNKLLNASGNKIHVK